MQKFKINEKFPVLMEFPIKILKFRERVFSHHKLIKQEIFSRYQSSLKRTYQNFQFKTSFHIILHAFQFRIIFSRINNAIHVGISLDTFSQFSQKKIFILSLIELLFCYRYRLLLTFSSQSSFLIA